jgi:hypothetical protein
MLAGHVDFTVLFMAEKVVVWAIDHLEGLPVSSEERNDRSWSLAFGASYVPSKHVVSNVGIAADPPLTTGYTQVHVRMD